jgi:2,3-bisphosphoglycerate-independent phosphoglycerate mutase
LGLSDYDAEQLTRSIAVCDCFEAAFAVCNSAKDAANWMISEVMNILNGRQMTYDMLDIDGKTPFTAHTTNPVNFIVVGGDIKSVTDGGLSDIAPTMLKILGIEQPKDMTGHSLI